MEPPLDSVASVQAKLNMLTAVEEELAGRVQAIATTKELLDGLLAAGLPPFKTFAMQQRQQNLASGFETLELMCAEYKQVLHAAMAHQEKLEETRLTIAKRTEALNRWFEDTSEYLTEAFDLVTAADAEAQLAELGEFKGKLGEKGAKVASVSFYAAEGDILGVTSNPYSRFTTAQIEGSLAQCEEEMHARQGRLEEARESMIAIDGKKKEFAAAAETVVLFLRGEKQALEASTPLITISADAPESLKRGYQMVEGLKEYAAASDNRKAQLVAAQTLSDALFTAGELDNPYTRESMASLKSQLDLLEQLVHDKQMFVESQLSAADVELSPEQKAEAGRAFHHFDKSGDGFLNEDEFTAAIKSMDFENPDSEMHEFFEANSRAEGEKTIIDIDAFTRFLGQQYKSKDTMDGLVEAFKIVSNGKDAVAPEQVSEILPEGEASFLLSKLEKDELAFMPFANHVYGAQPS